MYKNSKQARRVPTAHHPRSQGGGARCAPNRKHRRRRGHERGFTLLELIVVVAMIGILAAMALPNLIQTPRRADEAVLKTNLRTLRQVIDQYYGDKGFYPASLEDLVTDGYLRDVPLDPLTDSNEWCSEFENPDDALLEDPDVFDFDVDVGDELMEPGIIDVKSCSEESSLDGEPYNEW